MRDSSKLRLLADRMLRGAKACLERDGGVHPVFALEVPGRDIELIEITGKLLDLMDSGAGKDILFATLREWIRRRGATACVIVTEAYRGRSTEAGNALDRAEFDRLWSEAGWDKLLADRLVTREEVILITAQDAETVFLITQPFERDPRLDIVTYGPQDVWEQPQAQFEGRQKMFGDMQPEKLHQHRTSGLGRKERARRES